MHVHALWQWHGVYICSRGAAYLYSDSNSTYHPSYLSRLAILLRVVVVLLQQMLLVLHWSMHLSRLRRHHFRMRRDLDLQRLILVHRLYHVLRCL